MLLRILFIVMSWNFDEDLFWYIVFFCDIGMCGMLGVFGGMVEFKLWGRWYLWGMILGNIFRLLGGK